MEHEGRAEGDVERHERRRTAGGGATASLVAFIGAVALIAGAAATSRYLATANGTPTPLASGSGAASPSSSPPWTMPVIGEPAATPTGTSDLPLIPWIDVAAVFPTDTPYVAPTTPPVPMCRARDLKATVDPTSVASQELNVLITIARSSGSPATCYLLGTPTVTIKQSGRTVALLRSDSDVGAGPVTIGPADTAWLPVRLSSMCRPDRTIGMTIVIGLPSGTLEASAAGIPLGQVDCPESDPSPSIEVFPFAAWVDPNVPNPLIARLELPASVVAGEPLAFAVVVTNTGESAYSLDPCPYYAVYLIADAGDTGQGMFDPHLLNCPAMGTEIPPGTAVHLSIIYNVPEDIPAGKYQLVWLSIANVKASIEILPALHG